MVKNTKKSFSPEPKKKLQGRILLQSIGDLRSSKFLHHSNDEPRLVFDLFTARSNLRSYDSCDHKCDGPTNACVVRCLP